jgi:hypothetical protein
VFNKAKYKAPELNPWFDYVELEPIILLGFLVFKYSDVVGYSCGFEGRKWVLRKFTKVSVGEPVNLFRQISQHDV